jgi:pimeloyl-ACP methyl ester carboxylesterase
LQSLYDDPLTPKLGSLDCPVLLIVGANDPMGPRASSIIADALPNAELHTVPDCGHWVHVEAPEAVLGALDPWLARALA